MDYFIHKGKKEDFEKIKVLWDKLWTFNEKKEPSYQRNSQAEKKFTSLFNSIISDNESSCIFVADNEKSIIGYIMASIWQKPAGFKLHQFGSIIDTFVREKYRRQGIGSELLKRVKKWFMDNTTIRRLEVNMVVNNEVSMNFWRKNGFIPFSQNSYLNLK